MVTPPVALAAYAAAAIAGSGVMATGIAAFRFALVGFALPYAFVLRPALLWLNADGGRTRNNYRFRKFLTNAGWNGYLRSCYRWLYL